MNRDIAAGHWHEWKGEMRERWGKLTDDDWQQVEGNREQLVGALQRHYGYTREHADLEVDEFVARHLGVPEVLPAMAGPLPDDTLGALPTDLHGYYLNPVDARDETPDPREEVRDVGEGTAEDNGVRAQPGDVLGLDTGGETTSLGDTAEDEDRRRADALRDAPREEPRVKDARH